MGNPRCKICGGTTQKWGSTRAGRPRFRCLACWASQSRRNDTHARLIQAKNSLNMLVKQGTLFTYLNPALDLEGDPIARTSNLIEGGINTQLRCMLVA